MMRKYIIRLLLLFVMFVSISSITYAGVNGENDPAVLAAIYRNPTNYVRYGGQSTGVSYFIEKDSINVHKYAPPNYIISVMTVFYASNGMTSPGFMETARYRGDVRYAYDYSQHTMYIERIDENGNSVWEYIDPSAYGSFESYKSGRDAIIAAGEIAFYLAYNMSFYESPVSLGDKIINGDVSATFKSIADYNISHGMHK